MSKDKRIPYTWQEIEDQIRESIIAQASMIGTFGPQDNYTDVISSFLGTNVEICAAGDITDEEEARIDITRHRLYYYAHEAYNFAYQIDDRFCTSEAYDIDCGLLNGYAQTDNHGTPAPLCTRNDFPLRRVFQTYLARKNLQNGESLTIRELSLLSNMGEPTVRSSISKEGFQLESEPNTKEDKSRVRLSAEDAYVWLSRRRGYIPNKGTSVNTERQRLISAVLKDQEVPFPAALERIFEVTDISQEQVIENAQLPDGWLEELLDGKPVGIDMAILRQLSSALEVDTPLFVGKSIQHLLQLEEL